MEYFMESLLTIEKIVDDEKINVVILCALDEEFDALQTKMSDISHHSLANFEYIKGSYNAQTILLFKTGIGLINAASAVTTVILKFNPNLLLFVGIAGGLDPSLRAGDVIIADSCIHSEGVTHEKLEPMWQVAKAYYTTNQELLNNLPVNILTADYQVRLGTLLSSDLFPAPENFQEFLTNKSAIAIDMETAAVYQVCQEFGKPCLAIRGISNLINSSKDELIDYIPVMKAAFNAADNCFHIVDHFLKQDIKMSAVSVPSGDCC
jgi:5'-methylthioadenosine/S-adenosylhomocysteine nucleosidase